MAAFSAVRFVQHKKLHSKFSLDHTDFILDKIFSVNSSELPYFPALSLTMSVQPWIQGLRQHAVR